MHLLLSEKIIAINTKFYRFKKLKYYYISWCSLTFLSQNVLVSDGSKDFTQLLEKGPGSIQAQAWLFEKCLENWSFYSVKIRGPSRLGLEVFWKG